MQDHPYQRHFFDTWSLIPTLMSQTRRTSFCTDVANLPLRPPAVMAKAAATLDALSGGRFELGLGGGAGPELISNYGGPRRTPSETVEAVGEAIDVFRLLSSDAPSVEFEGTHYRVHDARPGPRPAHQIGIWLGAFKPRMIRLVGRKADGWLPSLGVLSREDLRAGNALIDEAAAAAGRGPSSIRRVLNVQGLIGDGRRLPGPSYGSAISPGSPWRARPGGGRRRSRRSVMTVFFWPVDPTPSQVERLASEVVPMLVDPVPEPGGPT